MEQLFTPKAARPVDAIATFLIRSNRFLLLITCALLPFVFIGGMVAQTKTFFVLAVVLLAMMIGSFGILRQSTIPRTIPLILLAWFGVVGVSFVSALLSVDIMYSLRGDMIETQTVAFLATMGLLMLMVISFGAEKRTAMLLVLTPVFSATILAVHQLLRLMFPGTFLDLGFLASPTDTLIGGYNDLGIFLTASILVMLIASAQLALPRFVYGVLVAQIVMALGILMTINISYLWIVLGLTSLLLLLYFLTKDRFGATSVSSHNVIPTILVMVIVFVVSTVFFVGGGALGAVVSNITGINYIEVRPSVTATLDIMRQSFAENAFTGTGPNQFGEAWLRYKDASINQTIFWNTRFGTGSSYILTWFVTTGIIGILAWVIFFALFMYRGIKTLFTAETKDTLWFFVGTVSFVLATFLWVTLWIYVAGPVILFFAAIMTGLYIVAERALTSYDTVAAPKFFVSTRMGFALISVVMLVVIGTVATSYAVARQFASVYSYVSLQRSITSDTTPESVSARLAQSYILHPNPLFLRDIVSFQFVQLNSLLAIQEPDTTQRQQFNEIIESMVRVATEATVKRPYQAQSWTMLGDVYALLAELQLDGAAARAIETYERALLLDPRNPYYHLQIAFMKLRENSSSNARASLATALQLRPNYVEALATLAQLDIEEGNIEQAVRTTEALVILEPNNAGRLYQLGLLYGAAGNREAAVGALTRAIEISPQFANARYVRALHRYANGAITEAVAELTAIGELDENNVIVKDIIAQMEAGTLVPDFSIARQLVQEPVNVSVQDDIITSSEAPDSALVAPVNTPAQGGTTGSSNTVTTDQNATEAITNSESAVELEATE
jgi:tetratricopeptide (TPR) repeat protein